uniref:uncharacterized protein isoform X2 n=1 Tax=Myxine glutinosa TaxID=7769 RepID=UPI00358F4DF5
MRLFHQSNRNLLVFLLLPGMFQEYQAHEANNCTMFGVKTLCVQSEVIGLLREAVDLTCQFTNLLDYNMKNLSVVWFRSYSENDMEVIYNSTTEYIQEEFRGRLDPQGDASRGNGSLKVSELKMDDEGTYICVFEFYETTWLHWWTVSRMESANFRTFEGNPTHLRVDVRPEILDISTEFVSSSTRGRLLCEAAAKPEPTITWRNPVGHIFDSSEVLLASTDSRKVQRVIGILNITEEHLVGMYVCQVENHHGMAQNYVIYHGSGPPSKLRVVLWVIIATLAVAAGLVLFLVFVQRWRHEDEEI